MMGTISRHECPTCGAQLVQISADKLQCPACGNEYNINSDLPIGPLLTANTMRLSLNFSQAEIQYKSIIQSYPDIDLSDVYWGLFLCEQRCMFESEENDGNRLPSFYDVVESDILTSPTLQKAISCAQKFGDTNKAKTYAALAKRMDASKKKYRQIKNTSTPYDVFICFKKSRLDGQGDTIDLKVARNIYNQLCKEYNVFFSEESLNTIVVRDYEPNIYYALYTAKVMVVICSDARYINAKWVKNEWSRFLQMSKNTADPKTIIPIFIGQYSAEKLPDELKSFQGLRRDENLIYSLRESIREIVNPTDKNAEMRSLVEEQVREQMKSRGYSEGFSNAKNMLSAAEIFFKQKKYAIAGQHFAACLTNDINDYYSQFMCYICSFDFNSFANTWSIATIRESYNEILNSLMGDCKNTYCSLQKLFDILYTAFNIQLKYQQNDTDKKITAFGLLLTEGINYIINSLYVNPTNRNGNDADEFKKQFMAFLSDITEAKYKNVDYAAIRITEKYCLAQAYVCAGDYFNAYQIFKNLDVYDSQKMCKLCEERSCEERYQNAISLLEQKKLDEAETEWRLLYKIRYKESAKYMRQVYEAFRTNDYILAVNQMKAKKYEDALTTLRAIRGGTEHYDAAPNGFAKSIEYETNIENYFMEKDYQAAMVQMKKKDYNAALGIFRKLIDGTEMYTPPIGGYKNARNMIRKINFTTNVLHKLFPSKSSAVLCVILLLISVVLIAIGSHPTFLFTRIPKGAAIAVTVVGVVFTVISAGWIAISWWDISYLHLIPLLPCAALCIFGSVWFTVAPENLGFEISNVQELSVINNYKGAEYHLTNDIDCGGNDIMLDLDGTFDGNGYKLSNVKRYISDPTYHNYFIRLSNGSTMKNIIFDKISLNYTYFRKECNETGFLIYNENHTTFSNLRFYNITVPYDFYAKGYRYEIDISNPIIFRNSDYSYFDDIYIASYSCGDLQPYCTEA